MSRDYKTDAGIATKESAAAATTKMSEHCCFCNKSMDEVSENCLSLSTSLSVLLKSLQMGRLRGIVTIASCNDTDESLRQIQELAQELIQRDILLFLSGCSSKQMSELAKESLHQWVGECLGEVCDFLDIEPMFHFGSTKEIALFQHELARETGVEKADLPLASVAIQQEAQLVFENANDTTFKLDTIADTTALIDEHIHNKRLALNWCDRYHCTIDSFS